MDQQTVRALGDLSLGDGNSEIEETLRGLGNLRLDAPDMDAVIAELVEVAQACLRSRQDRQLPAKAISYVLDRHAAGDEVELQEMLFVGEPHLKLFLLSTLHTRIPSPLNTIVVQNALADCLFALLGQGIGFESTPRPSPPLAFHAVVGRLGPWKLDRWLLTPKQAKGVQSPFAQLEDVFEAISRAAIEILFSKPTQAPPGDIADVIDQYRQEQSRLRDKLDRLWRVSY
ncbi:hypothetical protein B0H17DRAFT_1096395 [Mycena rosella]|uniref:Uncharacterized protein n=1 Tax=Mycena rosella TaxID=1033263 RepID=A0AAD7CR76_MYCRO|nr:hypothetical protein B0H17DRAFT_1096395 [Mycena rosella]